jgi:hypothetical protein
MSESQESVLIPTPSFSRTRRSAGLTPTPVRLLLLPPRSSIRFRLFIQHDPLFSPHVHLHFIDLLRKIIDPQLAIYILDSTYQHRIILFRGLIQSNEVISSYARWKIVL